MPNFSLFGNGEEWILVSGLLDSDSALTLSPFFPTTPPRSMPRLPEGTAGTLTISFLDSRGRLIRQAVVPTEVICMHQPVSGVTERSRTFSTPVFLPPATRAIRIATAKGEVLEEIDVPDQGPAIALDWAPAGPETTGATTIEWRADHPADIPLTYQVFYTHDGQHWQTPSLPDPSPSVCLDFDELPGGAEARIRVVASDGVNYSVAQTQPFRVARKGLLPTILSVEPSSPVPPGELLLLRGQALDLERNVYVPESLRWTSSRDGELGTGDTLLTRLSPGLHEIRLDVGQSRPDAPADAKNLPNTQSPFAVCDVQVLPPG